MLKRNSFFPRCTGAFSKIANSKIKRGKVEQILIASIAHYLSPKASAFHACIIVERLSETSKYLSGIMYTEQYRFYEINTLNMHEICNGLAYTPLKWNMQNVCNIENMQSKNTFSKPSNRGTNYEFHFPL